MVTAELIWAAATKNADYRVRTATLNVVQVVDKWTQIRLYLDAAADGEPSVSKRAVELLALWVRKFNASFAQPTTKDKIALSSSLAAIQNLLPNQLSRELMFSQRARALRERIGAGTFVSVTTIGIVLAPSTDTNS
jgi:hypothetical protein